MIKYQLQCDEDHAFEGWFRSSDDFDVQAGAGFIDCPVCGSSDVRKAIMAPSIARNGNLGVTADRNAARLAEIRQTMSEAATRARDYVEKNFDYVGQKFPEEARQIHYGEKKARGIYGEATGKEVKELVDEGVEISPLPATKTDPDSKENKKKLN